MYNTHNRNREVKIFFINDSIRGVVSNEETFWSVLSENLSGAQGIALNTFKGDILQFLKEEKPDIIVINSIFRDIAVLEGIKRVVLLQDNFAAMRKLLPVDWKRVVKWFMNFGRDEFLIKERIQRNILANADSNSC